MTSYVPLGLSAVLLVTALVAYRAGDARLARRRGVFGAATVVALAVAALLVPHADGGAWLPAGLLKVAPAVTGLVALIAVGLGPVKTHGPRTISRIMILCAIAEAFLTSQSPLILAALWTVSAWVTWTEVKHWSGEEPWHRVFAWYQGASVLSFGAGSVLLTQGNAPRAAVVLVLVGIAIREGALPLHSWFPRLVERAPMGLVVAFAGPQLGIYAQLELLGQGGVGSFTHEMAVVAVITAIGAAMLGAVQKDARRAVAHLILSQTGLVAFGLESHSAVGLTGALLNWQVLALATSGFAMVLAALEARRGSLRMHVPSGNFSETPKLAIAFLLLGFASVGFPLTVGFVAEDLLVQGTTGEFPLLGLSLVVATAFNGITVLRTFFYLFTGTRQRSGMQDLTRRERWVVGVVMATLVTFGVAPHPVVSFEKATERVSLGDHTP
jgi:NADH-quinone oxidoreductase subunit M